MVRPSNGTSASPSRAPSPAAACGTAAGEMSWRGSGGLMGDPACAWTFGRDVLERGLVHPDGQRDSAGDTAGVVGRADDAAVGDDDRTGEAPPLDLDSEQRPAQASLLARIVGEDRQLRERGAEAAAHWSPPAGI